MARGTIRKITTPSRKDARWEARLSGRDRDGARRQFRRRFSTRKAAEAWLSATETSVVVDGISVSPEMTVAQYGSLWMARMEREWASSTTYACRSRWRNRIVPALGDRRLDDLRRIDCQRFVDRLSTGDYSASYVRGVTTQLRSMLNSAVRDELIVRNPASSLTLPRLPKRTPATWTGAQCQAFLAHIRQRPIYPIVALMLATGMRIGETLGLSWRNVDLDAGQLRVVATMSLSANGEAYVSPTTKTDASRRTIPIPAPVRQMLRDHQDRQYAQDWPNPHELVFLNTAGDRFHPSAAREMIRRAIAETDLPPLSPHGFRHSAASLLLSAGTPAKVVQELLGHSSIAMTMDIYSHLGPDMRQHATDELGALLTGDGEENEVRHHLTSTTSGDKIGQK